MAKKYLDDSGLSYLWGKLKEIFQVKLVSGTNIKTINDNSLLGSGNITISGGGGGTLTDVTVDGNSVVQGTVAAIDLTNKIDTAGTGLSKSGTTINHSNSVTSGTIGTSSATSGSTVSVPYATYDSQGHITAKGTHTHTITGFVPTSRTVNSKALSSNITLSASDVSAVPTTRKVNDKALSSDISLTASDVGALATGTYIRFDSVTSTGYSFSANQYRTITRATTPPDGYNVVVIEASCTSHSAIRIFNYYWENNTITYEAINTSSSSISSVNFAFRLLYIKSSIFSS